MSTLLIGIESYDSMKARTLAIAKGTYKPKKREPRVWFTSVESFGKVLSDRNRELLKLIAEEEPQSLTALAKLSGRAKSNLSRTLRTMDRYGIVTLVEGPGGTVQPRFPYTDIDLSLHVRD